MTGSNMQFGEIGERAGQCNPSEWEGMDDDMREQEAHEISAGNVNNSKWIDTTSYFAFEPPKYFS